MYSRLFAKNNSGLFKTIALAVLFFTGATRPHEFVAITEVLKNPAGASDAVPGDASHEFIEITNIGTDTLFLDSLFLFDNPGGIDSIVSWDTLRHGALLMHENCIFNSHLIAPGAIAVILDPDYCKAVVLQPSCAFSIAANTVILTIDDNSIGNDGLSDNDGCALYKGTRKSINRILSYVRDGCASISLNDTLRQTTPRFPEGVSLIPTSLLFCPPAYASCPTSTSPGRYEGISTGWLVEWKLDVLAASASSVPCSLACIKAGHAPSASAAWSIERSNSLASEVIAHGNLSADEPVTRFLVILPLDSFTYQLKISENGASSAWPIDLSSIWTPPSAIRINEVFPRAQTDVPEWFELVNVSAMPISLKNWRYGTSQDSATLTTDATLIAAGRYCVVTKDKTAFSRKYPSVSCVCQPGVWHALDNYRDTLKLWDNRGGLSDTIAYTSEWFDHWSDQSIERVSPQRDGMSRDAWALSIKPTPGQPNGASAFRAAQQPSIEIGPVLFTPNGDGKDDLLSIRLVLPASFTVTVSMYGFNGKKYIDMPITPQPIYLWDGKMNNGGPAPTGPFFVVATFKNGAQTTLVRKKGILWR